MVYVDTSIIVKLYLREAYTREASDWLRDNNEAIPLTPFHELEFTNAVKLKLFRNELTEGEVNIVFEKFREHEKREVFFRPQVNWSDAFVRSLDLSKTHTHNTGSRTLDIIHVAIALSIGAGRFITFDKRQSQLASAAGLQIETCIGPSPFDL